MVNLTAKSAAGQRTSQRSPSDGVQALIASQWLVTGVLASGAINALARLLLSTEGVARSATQIIAPIRQLAPQAGRTEVIPWRLLDGSWVRRGRGGRWGWRRGGAAGLSNVQL
jgi:hypothetical protein